MEIHWAGTDCPMVNKLKTAAEAECAELFGCSDLSTHLITLMRPGHMTGAVMIQEEIQGRSQGVQPPKDRTVYFRRVVCGLVVGSNLSTNMMILVSIGLGVKKPCPEQPGVIYILAIMIAAEEKCAHIVGGSGLSTHGMISMSQGCIL